MACCRESVSVGQRVVIREFGETRRGWLGVRIQTVDGRHNRRYRDLIEAFYGLTGCPVIINTSFNVRGEPIVCTPEDAFRCFMGTEIETLAVGNCFLRKQDQDPALKKNYAEAFELD